MKDLNNIYRNESALYTYDFDSQGFEWIHCNDWEGSILAFIRKGRTSEDTILAVMNFTPVPRDNYRVGVPTAGYWRELLNSDAGEYGGSGRGNGGGLTSEAVPCHRRENSLSLTIPPLATLYLKNIKPKNYTEQGHKI